MNDPRDAHRPRRSTGCLASGLGAVALTLLAPAVLAVRSWRRWRRGSDVEATVDRQMTVNAAGEGVGRIACEYDLPRADEVRFRPRLTDAVIRMAEEMRARDDVYHLVYRLPWDEEPVALPVGPNLQELGERFSLVQSQATMAGRTAVWLTLGGEHALSEVVDPVTYDPEAGGEPDRLLSHPALRWSLASEWAYVGPSLVVRLIVVVPARHARRVAELLRSII